MKAKVKDFIEPKYFVLKVMNDNSRDLGGLIICSIKCKDIAMLSGLTEKQVRYAIKKLLKINVIRKRPDSKIDYIIEKDAIKILKSITIK